MRQVSLFENQATLAGVIPAIRAAMNSAAGQDADGRKMLVDRLNALASQSGVRLTGGNSRHISKDTLDKWLSPADKDHTPSILAMAAICIATKDAGAIGVLARACGLDVITGEERVLLEYGRATVEEEIARQRRKQIKERINDR